MTKTSQHSVELRRLAADQVFEFQIIPDAPERAIIAANLKLSALRKVRFEGEIRPSGKSDWALYSRLGATIVQPCVVTLDPVSTRVDVDINRTYVAHLAQTGDDDDEGYEVPEDDSIEAIPAELNLYDVMIEALTLEIPDYPRAADATLENTQFTAPGVAPMTDDDAKPLAGLAALKKRLEED